MAAGRTQRLTLGPPGRLHLHLPGPLGPLRVAFRARPRLGGRPLLGYTGSPQRLLPGSYDLTIGTLPPLQRRVSLARMKLAPATLWILDEPFTALDLLRRLNRGGRHRIRPRGPACTGSATDSEHASPLARAGAGSGP